MEKFNPFSSIKTIAIEDCSDLCSSEVNKAEEDYFSIESLTNLIDNCPNLKSLSLNGFTLLIKNTQEDFSELKKFLEKYAHIIDSIDICLSNNVPVRFMHNNEDGIETYKNDLEKSINEKIKTKKKSCNISVEKDVFNETHIVDFMSIKNKSIKKLFKKIL